MTPFSAPYAAANLTMLATEVLINSDQTTATVQWSEPYNGATARAVGSTVTLPTGLGTGQQGNYFIMGEVYYNYTPLNFYTPASAMTLHDAIYLTPRAFDEPQHAGRAVAASASIMRRRAARRRRTPPKPPCRSRKARRSRAHALRGRRDETCDESGVAPGASTGARRDQVEVVQVAGASSPQIKSGRRPSRLGVCGGGLVGIASPSLAMAQTAFQRGSDRLRFGVAARLASPPPLRDHAAARASLRRVCAARRARTSEKGCGGDVRIASLRVRRRAARPIGRDVERSKSPKNQRLTIANEDGAADGRAAQERKRGGAVDGPRPQELSWSDAPSP